MQEGSYSKMMENAVRFYSGHLQVQQEDFWTNKTINNTFIQEDSLMENIMQIDGIELVIPRLESFALASGNELTKGSLVLGIDPRQENRLTRLKEKLIRGTYLKDLDQGILMGSALAKYLQVDVKDTLVLLSQGYHGVHAAGLFPIRGIIKHPSPLLDRQLILMPLETAQSFYSAENMLTSLAITIDEADMLPQIMTKMKQKCQSPYRVISWSEMQPELDQQINSDRESGAIIKMILYLVIGFGILGTIIMMVAERRREFGVLVSIGMQKHKLALILTIETFFIGLMGILSGIMVSLPLLIYQVYHPILMTGRAGEMIIEMGFEPYMYFSIAPKVFTFQLLTIFLMVLIISIYPIVKSLKLKENQAIRA